MFVLNDYWCPAGHRHEELLDNAVQRTEVTTCPECGQGAWRIVGKRRNRHARYKRWEYACPAGHRSAQCVERRWEALAWCPACGAAASRVRGVRCEDPRVEVT